MKPQLLILTALLIATLPAARLEAQTAKREPAELTAFRARYQADLENSAKPIQARYIFDLQGLLKTLTQRADLAGALAVQKELDAIHAQENPGKPSAYNLAGTKWISGDGSSQMEFQAGARFAEAWHGHHYTGTWHKESERDVVVKRTDNIVYHYFMSNEGTSLTRKDGMRWTPIK